MDAKPAFDLTEALSTWRQRLRAVPNLSDDDVTEMESHLLDSVEEWRGKGLSEQEAFWIACQRFGDSRVVGVELAEVNSGAAPAQAATATAGKRSKRLAWGLAAAGFFLLVGGLLALVSLSIIPKRYRGTVVMEIKRDSEDTTLFGDAAASKDTASSTFMANQFKSVTSKESLYRVIDTLGLTRRWTETGGSREEACARLAEMTKTETEPGTDLIRISVLSTDKNEAAELANALASAYAERRRELDRKKLQNTVDLIELHKKEQMEKVEKARTRMLEIMEQDKIIDFGAGSGLPGRPVEDGMRGLVGDAAKQELELEKKVADLKTQIQMLAQKSGDDLIQAAAQAGFSDAVAQNLFPKYLQDLVELNAMLGTGRGENHPQILALKERINSTRKMLEHQVTALRSGLEAKLQLAEQSLANLKAIKEKTAGGALENSFRNNGYIQVRDDFELQSQVLHKMTATQLETRIQMSMPRTPCIIHESAVPPMTFAEPNMALWTPVCQLVMGTGFVLLVACLILWPKPARLEESPPEWV